jgi:hypothetical protein
MTNREDSDQTRPSEVGKISKTPSDTQPVPATKVERRKVSFWLRFIIIGAVVVLVWGGAGIGGYVAGMERRQLEQAQALEQTLQQQFDLGIENLLAGEFEVAKQRFQYVLLLNPEYPGAMELLNQTLSALNEPTPTARPLISPTPTVTPDLRSYEGMFISAQDSFGRGDWSTALDLMVLIRGNDPTYRLGEINQMMQVALRNRGMDMLFEGRLEEGIFNLNLAERFGPLDGQAQSWRRSAAFFLFANSYIGLDWSLATDYFSQICVANIWGACAKYAQSAREYGNLLVLQEDYCRASLNYDQFYLHQTDPGLDPTATEVMSFCMTATAPTPTGTMTSTPGTETPSGTLTSTSTPSPTSTPMPGATDTPSIQPTNTFTVTPSATTGPPPTQTSTYTETVSPTPTATPTLTPTPTS